MLMHNHSPFRERSPRVNKKTSKSISLMLVFVFLCLPLPAEGETLLVFAGAAMKPVMEEVNKLYRRKTGVEIVAQYGGGGKVLSQMIISGTGDLYAAPSSDFMEKAQREGVIDPHSVRLLAYLIPAIIVPKGNPQKITSLRDLATKEVKLAIGNPRIVAAGAIAEELFEFNNLSALVKPKIQTYTESVEQLASLIIFGTVDAIIGWEVLQHWNPERIETILLKPEEIPRITSMAIAISKFTRNREQAEKYMNFVTSPESKTMFNRWGYITEIKEAREYAPYARIEGSYAPHEP